MTLSSSCSTPRRRTFGLLVWREHWTLTRRSKLLALVLALGLIALAHWAAYPFLAVNHPQRGEVLVVEGWLPVYTLHQAAAEFTNGPYRQVLIVRALQAGEPGVEHGRHTAEYAATVLRRGGVPSNGVEIVYFSGVPQDRTYHSALEVKRWLTERHESVKSFDVITLGPHARRSRLLYQRAFGDAVEVGVIALPDPAYDPRHWWRSSEGVREVFGESLAYLYARFLFWI